MRIRHLLFSYVSAITIYLVMIEILVLMKHEIVDQFNCKGPSSLAQGHLDLDMIFYSCFCRFITVYVTCSIFFTVTVIKYIKSNNIWP